MDFKLIKFSMSDNRKSGSRDSAVPSHRRLTLIALLHKNGLLFVRPLLVADYTVCFLLLVGWD
jgi:hypothetical protein